MFFALGMLGNSLMFPDSTSIVANRNSPNVNVSSDDVKRSVENASDRPSGDQAGWRSANASDVSERTSVVARSMTSRSLKPLRSTVNARRVPSGDHVGLKT